MSFKLEVLFEFQYTDCMKIKNDDKIEFALTGINEILANCESFDQGYDDIKEIVDNLTYLEKIEVYKQYLANLDSEWVIRGEKKGMKELFSSISLKVPSKTNILNV